ncbi:MULTISPECIES: hypothetical protein [Pseudomonas]|uniref:Uncharacterized protein n=1 Tax=Pseudomonas fluorescens TaxID=294 RepID=A0A0F4TF78_PSEFL|nr:MULTISPECIES: hypothetical protein [Pseudomonas]KJZ43078.1 hypothetical protein VC35_21830 [Pseudomonas fluorescens]
MNIKNLEASAIDLEQQLIRHSTLTPDAADLYRGLKPLLELVKTGKIVTPIEWGEIPGQYFFTEKGLQIFEELEEAYAKFSIEITGGESPALKLFREQRRQQ